MDNINNGGSPSMPADRFTWSRCRPNILYENGDCRIGLDRSQTHVMEDGAIMAQKTRRTFMKDCSTSRPPPWWHSPQSTSQPRETKIRYAMARPISRITCGTQFSESGAAARALPDLRGRAPVRQSGRPAVDDARGASIVAQKTSSSKKSPASTRSTPSQSSGSASEHS